MTADRIFFLRVWVLFLCTHFVSSGKDSLPPEFLSPPRNVSVRLGGDASFSCSVAHLTAPYKVTWIFAPEPEIHIPLASQGEVITMNPRISASSENQETWYLHIANVRRNDTGKYICQINTIPSKKRAAQLSVLIPPDIIAEESSSEIIALEFHPVRMGCTARGTPLPTITWERKDNKLLQLDHKVSEYTGRSLEPLHHTPDKLDKILFQITRSLELPSVSREDMGTYRCIASNGVLPVISKNIQLYVRFSPTIRDMELLVGAQLGQDILLECLGEAFPKPIMYWFNGQPQRILQNGSKLLLHEQTLSTDYQYRMSLTIKNATAENFGVYTCAMENPLGSAKGMRTVFVTSNVRGSRSEVTPLGMSREGTQDSAAVIVSLNSESKSSRLFRQLDLLAIVLPPVLRRWG